jgi:hypothetical protein
MSRRPRLRALQRRARRLAPPVDWQPTLAFLAAHDTPDGWIRRGIIHGAQVFGIPLPPEWTDVDVEDEDEHHSVAPEDHRQP